MTGRRRDETGTTLMELVVGMLIMTIFLGIFTGSILTIFHLTNRAQAVVDTSSNNDAGFHQLDRSVRYAAAISTPGQSSTGYWYVEFLVSDTGSSVCTQLRVNTGAQQLQSRTWTVNGSGYTNLTSWLPLANEVTNGNATAGSTTPPVPFTLNASSANIVDEQLSINLVTAAGNPSTTSTASFGFTALNSSAASSAAASNSSYSQSICTQVGRP